jgi:hypothetical protein
MAGAGGAVVWAVGVLFMACMLMRTVLECKNGFHDVYIRDIETQAFTPLAVWGTLAHFSSIA